MLLYGLTPESVATDDQGNALVGVNAQVFTALTGGSVYGQIYKFEGTMTPGPGLGGVVTTDERGRIAFFVDGSPGTLFLDFNDGSERWPVNPTEITKVVGDLVTPAITDMQNQLDQAIADARVDIDAAVDLANEAKDLAGYANTAANVLQFGALGDGGTDDTAAFQAAIDSLSDGGGEVIIPGGRTYVINGAVELRSKINFRGDGAVITKTAPSPYVIFVALSRGRTGYGSSVTDVSFYGIRFVGNFSTPIFVCPFALHHAARVVVERCVFDQCQGTGHTADLAGCEEITFRDCTWYGFHNNLTGGYNRTETIQCDQSQGNAVSYPDDAGSYDGLLTRRVTVENCRFLPLTVNSVTYPCPNPVGAHGQREGQLYSDIKIIGNTIVDPVEDQPVSSADNGWLVGVIHFPQIRGLLIDGNRFVQTKNRVQRVISVVSVSSGTLATSDPNLAVPVEGAWATPVPATDIKITNNTIIGFTPLEGVAGPPAIFVRGVDNGYAEDITIEGNTIQDGYRSATTLGGRAVFVQKANRIAVVGNKIKNFGYGIDVSNGTNAAISSNVITETYNWPMVATTFNGLSIIGNTLRRWRKPVQTQGDVTDLAISHNTFTDCQITGNDAAGIVCAGTGSVRFTIIGNLITNNTGTQPRAIAILSTANYGVIASNVMVGYTTPGISPGTPPNATIVYPNNIASATA